MSTNIFELILLQRENPNSSPFLNSLLMFQNQWILMKTVFEKLFQDHECDRAHATDIWLQINQNSPSLVSVTINYYLDELNQKLAHKYQQEFFSYFGDIDSGNENVNLQQFLQAFHYLNQIFQIHKAFSSILELKDHPQLAKNNNIDSHQIMENVIGKFKIAILNTKKFRTIVFMFLNLEYRLFKNHVVGTMSNEGEIEDLELIQYENSQLEQNFQFDGQLLVSFSEVLYELEFFDKLHEIIYIFTTDKLINYTENAEKVMDSPTGGPYLHRLLDYFQRFIKSFILQLYFKIAQVDENHRTALTDLISRLVYFIYELYAKKMINKMCDIILDAEEINLKTIHEIREATEKAHMMNNLAKSLIQQIKARLLIPGVITQTIIRYFIDTVKILQLIDPTGSIYDTVTNPLKNYLLQRPDALRGIIDILTEDTDAYTKLGQNTITIPTDQYVENSNDMSSDEDEKAAENWQVLPLQNRVHAKSSVKYKVSDMVTWLVNLYGSQEAFINEYQNMLGEKLITITEPTKIDEEIKKFELLKAKFGDNYLQNCQVIVRDIRDSKRINKNIHRTHDKQFVKMELENANDAASDSLEFKKLNAIFLSKSYWPINYDYEAFKIPAHLQQTFDQYTEKYSETKAMRRLIWHHSLGGVELNLSFDNGSFTFKCLPTHAILIGYFDERNNGSQGVSLDFLSSELNMPTTTVRQLMSFWVHKGVVQEKKSLNTGGNSVKKNPAFAGYFTTGEQGDVGSIFYVPVKEYDGTQNESLDINEDVENELMKGGQLSGDATQFNTLIEGLIVIMLKTNGPKSVEKIHQLLKTVYRTDIPHSYTENQTKEILRKMLAKQTIAFNGEVYSTRV